jgi:hypothetical protein
MVSYDDQESSLPWLCCFDLSNRVIDSYQRLEFSRTVQVYSSADVACAIRGPVMTYTTASGSSVLRRTVGYLKLAANASYIGIGLT